MEQYTDFLLLYHKQILKYIVILYLYVNHTMSESWNEIHFDYEAHTVKFPIAINDHGFISSQFVEN